MKWKCYFDEMNKNKMIIVCLNGAKGLIEIRMMEADKENMRLNKKLEIELKNYEFNHKEMDKISHLFIPKDNYLILFQWGENRSRSFYYVDTDTGETFGKTEFDGELWSTCVSCVSKSNDIICYSNEPQAIYYLEFDSNLRQILNKRELINGKKKYKGKIDIKKQNEFLIVRDDDHVEIYEEDNLKRNGLKNPYFEAKAKISINDLASIENGYLLLQSDRSEFLLYKLNQFDKPLITINKHATKYSFSPNNEYLIIGTGDNELIGYKSNDSSNMTQFAYLKLNEEIYQILSSDQYIYIKLESWRLLTFKIINA